MPRNSQGVYSLPVAPFVPGTVISSSSVNSDFSDIATALTGSVAANGVTPITGQLQSTLTSTPAYSFNFDTTTGFGSTAAGTASIWAGGAVQVAVTSSSVTVNQPTTINGNLAVTGTLTAGSIAFTGTGAVQIPAGTTAQRPGTSVTGDIRYNSTTANFEGYDGTEWQVMSNINTAYKLTASVGSGILTINVLNAKTDAAPTAADPIAFDFRPFQGSIILATSALSINTNAIGATLGTTNSVPFRFWLVVVDNAGAPVLALVNCSTPTQIFPLLEGLGVNTTGMSNAATSAGVFYTPNGVNLSGVAYRILGYIEYDSGLGTAGNYSTTPTVISQYTSGTKKPGEAVQVISKQDATNQSGPVTTALSQAISPTSAVNLVKYEFAASVVTNSATASGQIYKSGSPIGQAFSMGNGSLTGNLFNNLSFLEIDAPGTTSSTTYAFHIGTNGGYQNGNLILTELMG
jgi:hypothetical protein